MAKNATPMYWFIMAPYFSHLFATFLGVAPSIIHYGVSLVGGFIPSEKYARQIGFIFPNFRGENENKQYLKPPPS